MNAYSTYKSDFLGAAASALCAVHCLATPFIFVAQTCSISGCCSSSAPAWWTFIDYLFIGITLFAVYWSARNTSKPWMKYALYGSWFVLSVLIISERFALFPLASYMKYGAAFVLIVLHLYNLKYCQCKDEICVAESNFLEKE